MKIETKEFRDFNNTAMYFYALTREYYDNNLDISSDSSNIGKDIYDIYEDIKANAKLGRYDTFFNLSHLHTSQVTFICNHFLSKDFIVERDGPTIFRISWDTYGRD